jgi:hypothetical protein
VLARQKKSHFFDVATVFLTFHFLYRPGVVRFFLVVFTVKLGNEPNMIVICCLAHPYRRRRQRRRRSRPETGHVAIIEHINYFWLLVSVISEFEGLSTKLDNTTRLTIFLFGFAQY